MQLTNFEKDLLLGCLGDHRANSPVTEEKERKLRDEDLRI